MVENSRQRHVGRIVGLWRYPVKSMAAEALERVDVSWFGLAGDRRWAFVRDKSGGSGFPWFTIRDRSEMHHFKPFFADPSQPDKSKVMVQTPTGKTLAVTDPELVAAMNAGGARVIKQDRGIFDTFPVSLITTQTIAKLGDMVGTELEAQRFRPNLLVEASGDQPFSEDAWVGRIIRVGHARIRIDKRDGRCTVITIDPKTTEKNPDVLRTVAKEREGCLGVYGSVVKPGALAMGDNLFLE